MSTQGRRLRLHSIEYSAGRNHTRKKERNYREIAIYLVVVVTRGSRVVVRFA